MPEPGPPDRRIVAIDWMRGFVMILMAVDHASIMFNSGRLGFDSGYPIESLGYVAGTPLPLAQFMTRWITHICAPTFLFLSGTSLALSVERRLASGEAARSIDRHLAIRGLILILLDATYISLGIRFGSGLVLQVLYAIGASLILMVPLRRLPSGWLVAFGLLWLVGGEALTLFVAPIAGDTSILAALSVAPGEWPRLYVMYPALPWLAMMALGWAFGRHLLRRQQRDAGWSAERICVAGGVAGLAVFAVVRGLNSYGNLVLYRGDASLVQWLHTSKYPPSLAFASMELGLMCLCLAALFALQRRVPRPRDRNPVLVFGQTALFFYLAHFAVLFLMLIVSGQGGSGGLPATYLAVILALVPLYPLCLWYRRYKAAHPRGWPQYI